MTTLLLLAAGVYANAQQNRAAPSDPVARSEEAGDSAQDGLAGPVRRVRTEVADLLLKDGKVVEGPRALREVAVFDRRGRKADHSVYAVAGSQPFGRESYKHDARGNVVEMTVRDDAGSVVSREIYAYEFDALGNWTKMTTSVAVVENNNVTYEPTEVTYRTITYYQTDEVAKATLPPPSAPAEGPGPPAEAQNQQKHEAAEAAAPKLLAGAADGESRAATGQEAVPVETTIAPAVEVVPRPAVAPAVNSEHSDLAGREVAAANAPGGGPAESGRPAAAHPRAGETEAEPTIKKITSGGVLNGRAISLPRPVYSESLRRSGYEGAVKVKVTIDVTGRVVSAEAVSGPHQLRAAAVAAARRARFSPTLLSGHPVDLSGVIDYVFSITQ